MALSLFVVLPLMGAFIGWGTNLLAIRSLFRPVKPVKIPLTPWAIQGLVPKRKQELAASVGHLVERELVSWEDLVEKIYNSSFEREVLSHLDAFVREWLEGKVPRIVPRKVNDALQGYISDTLTEAFREKFPDTVQKLARAAEKEVDIRALVEEKISGMTLDGLEELVFSVARQELKQIEYLGAVIGLVVGVFQALLVYFWHLP